MRPSYISECGANAAMLIDPGGCRNLCSGSWLLDVPVPGCRVERGDDRFMRLPKRDLTAAKILILRRQG